MSATNETSESDPRFLASLGMTIGPLVFSSNCGCVTSYSAKIAPDHDYCFRSGGWARRRSLARREPVCAIARRTSKDSTGTEPAPRHAARNSQHERDSVGRTSTQRHYDSPDLLSGPATFPRSKDIPASRSVFFTFLSKAGDQRGLAHQTQGRLAARRRRKVEITGFTTGGVPWNSSETRGKRSACASRKRFRPEADFACGNCHPSEFFFSASGNWRQ